MDKILKEFGGDLVMRSTHPLDGENAKLLIFRKQVRAEMPVVEWKQAAGHEAAPKKTVGLN